MTYRADLIYLYATNTRKELEQLQEFQSLCHKFMMDGSFQAELHAIDAAKVYVERFLETSSLTLQAKVARAISLMVSLRQDKKQLNLCHELIVKGYQPSWSAAQQQYFDDAWEKIQYEHDFFLSFTCRCPPVPGDNPINSTYKAFIISEIGWEEFRVADKKSATCLRWRYTGCYRTRQTKDSFTCIGGKITQLRNASSNTHATLASCSFSWFRT